MFESVSQLLLHIIRMIKSTNSFSYYEYVVHLYIASLFIANYISNKNNQESFGSVGFIYFFLFLMKRKWAKESSLTPKKSTIRCRFFEYFDHSVSVV